ncbi:MAG TPA: AAA family ATPase [Mycobacterium sp.]|nr:AAA family ATPase [Mycobacterium sp.]
MAAKHRKGSRQVKKIAVVATATATVSALTVGAAPAPQPSRAVSQDAIDLSAAIRLLPNSGQVPDITGGLGSTIYNGSQAIGDQLIRAVVNGINLAKLAQAAGIDPRSLINTLLADIPANLLPGIISALALDLPLLDVVLSQVPGIGQLLADVLDALGLDELVDGSLTGLLTLIGLDLSNPLNLSNLLDLSGVNIVTAGPTFSILKMLGLDLGWTSALPNSVANAINNSPYLEIGANGLLTNLLDKLEDNPLVDILDPLGLLRNGLRDAIDGLTSAIPDVLDLRVVPTVGIGLGAFAAAMAYKQVIADLANQPGGLNYDGVKPLLGSLTLLPMILVNNPGRPDGGAFARFGPLAALFGINTVNPTTELTGNGGIGGPLGLHIGGANVLPILVDIAFEYQPMSDLASWPNPFTLANNLAAAMMPTYMLRGLTLEGLDDQLIDLVGDAVDEALDLDDPLALNIYLTLQSKALPLVEPLFLAADFLNLVGLGLLAQIPMRIANALMPALTILTNIGYSNVVRNPDGTYTRDFTNAGVETPFFSFANIDYGRALVDTFGALVGGIQKEFFSGNPTPSGPNVLKNLLDALLGGDLLGGTSAAGTPQVPGGTPSAPGNPLGDLLGGVIGGVGGLLGGLFGGLGNSVAPAAISAESEIGDVPDLNATFSRISVPAGAEGAVEDETGSNADESTEKLAIEAEGQADQNQAAEANDAEKPAEVPAEQLADEQPADETDPGAQEPALEQLSPGKHAKPEGEGEPGESPETDAEAKAPKHAKSDDEAKPAAAADEAATKPVKKPKPSLNVVRDITNAFSPKDKPGPVSESKNGNDGKGVTEAAAATDAGADASSEGSASDAA